MAAYVVRVLDAVGMRDGPAHTEVKWARRGAPGEGEQDEVDDMAYGGMFPGDGPKAHGLRTDYTYKPHETLFDNWMNRAHSHAMTPHC